MYMTDPATGDRWTLMSNPRPNSLDDSRFNKPKPGILYDGIERTRRFTPDHPRRGVLRLSHDRNVGLRRAFDVNWDSLLSYVRGKGYWSTLWPVLSRATASVEIETQTFGLGSRLRINHRAWDQWNP